jgi:peptidoglycan/LPS O-acetylase OafA/YrhL
MPLRLHRRWRWRQDRAPGAASVEARMGVDDPVGERKTMNWFQQAFEISHSNHKTNRSMEGLRGCAVFMVFLVHYVGLVERWMVPQGLTYQLAQWSRDIGHAGVDLFFVLSGYLIYGTLIRSRKPVVPYLARRVQRIYPTFLVVFALYLVLSFAFPMESKLPDSWGERTIYIVENLLLLPGLFDITPVLTVAWSLSYEFFFYLLMPLLITVLFLHSWPRRARIAFFLFVSVIGFLDFYFFGGHIRLLMFVAGIILYDVVDGKLIKSFPIPGLLLFALALVAMIAIDQCHFDAWWRYVALYVLFFGLCLESFTTSGITARLLSFAPLRWYGNISYSYYLIHGLSLKAAYLVLSRLLPPDGTGVAIYWLLFLPMFVLTLIPSALLFLWVEKPYSLAPSHQPKIGPIPEKALQPTT